MSTGIILDPALKNYAGHHLTAAAGWVDACLASGLTPVVLAHKECILDAIETASVEKTFGGHFYHVAPVDQEDARTVLRVNQRQFRDAVAGSCMRAQSEDVLVLAHSTLVTLNGIAAWASAFPRARLPRLIIWLMMTPEEEDFALPFGSTDCLIGAVDRLRAIFGDRLTLTGMTEDVCRRWKELCCEEIALLPFISLRPALPERKGHIAGSPPVIAFIGHLGLRKGLDLIPGIIGELERKGVNVRWMIAGECFDQNSTAFSEVKSLAKSRRNVSLSKLPAGMEDYGRHLTSADIILLPYCPDTYAGRGSGVAEEAESIGLPYVAPKIAFSAKAVAAGSAVAFEEWTVGGIAAAITAAVNDLQKLTRAAEANSRGARGEFGKARENFLLPLLCAPASAISATSARTDPCRASISSSRYIIIGVS